MTLFEQHGILPLSRDCLECKNRVHLRVSAKFQCNRRFTDKKRKRQKNAVCVEVGGSVYKGIYGWKEFTLNEVIYGLLLMCSFVNVFLRMCFS